MLFRSALVCLFIVSCSKTAGQKPAPEAPPAEPTGAANDDQAHDGHAGHKEHFEHRFENAEDWAKQFDDPKRDKWQKPARVAELLDIRPGMTVADIGAGTGYFLATFSKAVGDKGEVWGLDIEPDMVRYMTERAKKEGLANVTARAVATDDPGLEAASVDRIVIVNTWHHIADRVPYTKKLARALKPGGTVAIIDYTKEAPRGPPAKHRLTPAEVVAELEAGGLAAAPIEEDLSLQYIVIGKAPLANAGLRPSDVPFRNARSVDGILVGGQPTADELRKAAAAGVKTVINLQTASERGVADEAALAAELKLHYISIPVAGADSLNLAAAKKLDAALASAEGPVILHCGSGNRAGALLAIRAGKLQGKSEADAIALGKKAGLTSLEAAVKKALAE